MILREEEPLDPKIYTQGMARLVSVFPALKFQPDIYYEFLKDLREDCFMGGVNKVILEVKELFPNTNLIAVLREKTKEFSLEKAGERSQGEFKKIGYYEIIDDVKAEEGRKDFNALRNRLAAEKGWVKK